MTAKELLLTTVAKSATLFYQLKIEQAVAQFVSLADIFDRNVDQLGFSAEEFQHIQIVLNECMNALQTKEYILLADLLRFEILIPLNE